jgi:D-methionine transport system substrate-binding protein
MPKNSPSAPNVSRRSLLRGLLGAAAAVPVLGTVGCGLSNAGAASGGAGDKTIRIIASSVKSYQEPITIAQKLLAEKGWTLEAKFVNDIIQPNLSVAQGEYDANAFQHGAYLTQFNKDKGLNLVPLFYIRNSPAALYSYKHASLADLPQGGKVSIPVDPANNGRAFFMLQTHGLLTLREGPTVVTATKADIIDNPRNLEFIEVDQLSLSQTLEDVDAGFMFQSTAIDAGVHTQANLVAEDAVEDEIPYRSIFASTPEFAGTEKAKVLEEAIQSPEVAEFFKTYQDGFFELPWDDDPQVDLQKWADA